MRDRFDKCLDGLLPGNGGAVLLAVSGGIDSIVMADLFLSAPRSYDISLAHCNFHLRGEESDADEAFVRNWALSRGTPYLKNDFDTIGYASAKGLSVEMAARELRYSWFAALSEEYGFRAVAVAHNANDNAETLILNLLRGTGLKGICGMRASSPLPCSEALLIRPMLGFTRAEIQEYALAKGIKWREDSSNADSAYKRNLIRNEVFPLFEKVNPSFLETLNADMRRFSQVQAIADDFAAANLLEAEGEAYPMVVGGEASPSAVDTGVSATSVNVDDLLRFPHWEYLLFRWLGPYGFNEAVIGDMIELIKGGKTFSGKKFRSATHIARTSRKTIIIEAFDQKESFEERIGSEENGGDERCVSSRRPFSRTGREAQEGEGGTTASIEVTGPGKYEVEGTCFEVEVAEIDKLKQPEGVTAVKLEFPFKVRRWSQGDWMRPLGMGGRRKKLSDMFGDLKFSAIQKEKALVIVDEGSHVLALLGYRIDESVALPGQGRPFYLTAEAADKNQRTAVRIRLI